MKHYELLTVLPGTMVEDEVTAVLKEVVKVLETNGAADVIVHDKGKNKLAYPIKLIRYGYFHIAQFTAEPNVVPKIEEKLRLITELLRREVTIYDPEKRAHDAKYRKQELSANITTLSEIQKQDKKDRRRGNDQTSVAPATTEVADESEQKEVKSEEKKPKKAPKEETEKIKLDEIDQKLDEILDNDLKKV